MSFGLAVLRDFTRAGTSIGVPVNTQKIVGNRGEFSDLGVFVLCASLSSVSAIIDKKRTKRTKDKGPQTFIKMNKNFPLLLSMDKICL